MTDELDEDLIIFQAAAHQIRRAARKGELREGISPRFANLMAEILVDIGKELHVGSPEGAKGIIRDVLEAFESGDVDDDLQTTGGVA